MPTDYGDVSDGALYFDGVTAAAGITPIAGVYQLTANINATSITIDAGVKIFAANWQVYCDGAITGAGSSTSIIHCNGIDAPTPISTSPLQASAGPEGFYAASTAGNNGSSGYTHHGLPYPLTRNGVATRGGGGGASVPATDGQDGQDAMKGGAGGGATSPGQGAFGIDGGNIDPVINPGCTYDETEQKNGHVNGDVVTRFQWGSGGGGGGVAADGTIGTGVIEAKPGGGGGGGGCLYVAARTITGVRLQANGGAGHDGVAGDRYATCGGSGGGGGGGGVAILHYASKLDVVVEALGGTGGIGHTFGTGAVCKDGGDGFAGYTYLYIDTDVPPTVGLGGLGSFWWGPHFSDRGGGHYFFPHFPDGQPDNAIVPPAGPGAAATLVLDLQSGTTIVYTWDTYVFKSYSGLEQRSSKLDLPKRRISGQAFLRGDEVRATRAKLARYAPIGATFLIAMPHEEMTIAEDSNTAIIHVGDTSLIDWGVIGQRVVLMHGDLYVEEVVQDVGPTTITLSAAYPALALDGSRIMPLVAVILESTQGFARFPNPEQPSERWDITCEPILFGYEQDALVARAGFALDSGALVGATLLAHTVGSSANGNSLNLIGDLSSGSGAYVGGSSPAYEFHFVIGETTVTELASAIAPYGFDLGGTYDPSSVLTSSDVTVATLASGADQSWGKMGNGAVLDMFEGKPVWDRGVKIEDVAGDQLISLTTIIDLGGKPINVGQAKQSDWGRQVMATGDLGEPFQWAKLFLFTVCGRRRSWWLPTARADLDAVAGSNPGVWTLRVAGPSFASGDFFGWYPTLSKRLRIEHEDETVEYVTITDAVDNMNGTISVIARDSSNAIIQLSASPIAFVSWLELCRFEQDAFTFTISGSVFAMNTQARVVQR